MLSKFVVINSCCMAYLLLGIVILCMTSTISMNPKGYSFSNWNTWYICKVHVVMVPVLIAKSVTHNEIATEIILARGS